MKTLLAAFSAAALAVLLIGGLAVTSYGQCILHCPAGDGGISPGSGKKSVDMSGDGVVGLVDLSLFALAFPPNPYDYCADFDCDGVIGIIDLSIFGIHWGHQGTPGFCQPQIDHYKPYDILGGPTITGPIILNDQFGESAHSVMIMTKLATPVDKNAEGILDTLAHQTWYEFDYPEPLRAVTARDQFGEFDWLLGNSRYLVVPALKNPAVPVPELPKLNHYKCYEAQGPQLSMTLRLKDQFEEITTVTLAGVFFCNPVQKTTPDGLVYSIIDSSAHMTCYTVENLNQYGFEVFVWDQFVQQQIVLIDRNQLLCLPALKTQVIEPGSSEWRRVKALYDATDR
jgi:hypothetical protein